MSGKGTGNERARTRMRAVSRRVFVRSVAAGGLGLAGAYLGACGGGGSGTARSTAQPAAQATGAAATVKPGGTLKLAYGLEPSSLDPHVGNSGGDDYYWYSIFDNLVAYDQRFVSQPDLSLAQKWEIADPTTIVFQLRPGVKFHDGTDFNAEVVKWNIERVLNPDVKSTARSFLLSIDRVETPDPLTARFVLKEPNAALMGLLGGRGGAMVSRAAVEKLGKEFGSRPVGTGPFQFVEWAPGDHVTVKKNPTYWGKDANGVPLPYLDQAIYRIIPDPTVSFANLTTGEVHLAGINPKDLAAAQANPDLTVVKREGSGIASVMVANLAKAPLDNANLRRAVMWALDAAAVNKAVYFDTAVVADAGMWAPGTWVYAPVPSRPKYDPAKAKEYLRAGGAPDGFAFTMITYNTPILVQQAEIYQAQLAKVGIKATLEQRDVGAATSAFFTEGAFPLYSTSWSLYPEPDWVGSNCYTSTGFYNPMKKPVAPELDELVKKGRQTYDQEERKKIYARINEIVLGEAYFVPMLYGTAFVGFRKPVQNTGTLFGGEAKWRLKELWLKS